MADTALSKESLEKVSNNESTDRSTSPSERSKLENYQKDDSKQIGQEQTEAGEGGNWVSGFPLATILGAICLVCFLMLLDTSIIVTAIPEITNNFNSLNDVGWYGSAYQLASAAFLPLSGNIYVNFDPKWTFLTFFFIFELGSLICGVATDSVMLIVGRAIAGLGTSGIQNGAFTIIAECVPMEKRPSLIGMVMGISQLGLVVGPLIGGALTQYSTWRWCFYINLPIGGLVAVMLLFVKIPAQIPKAPALETARAIHKKLDLIGFVIFAPATIMLLLAVQYGGNQYAWNSSVVIGLFVGAGATTLVWLAWDWYKGDDAMIPLPMLKKMVVWTSCLVYGFLMSQLFSTTYYLPIYFQSVKGSSPTMSGVYLLPLILAQLFSAIFTGAAVERIGYYLPFSVIGSVLIAIGNGIISTFDPQTSTGKWIGYQILLGAGTGGALQMPLLAVQNTLPPVQAPVALALLMFSQTLGGALYLSFSDTIFTNSLSTLIPQYAPTVDPLTVIEAGATGFRRVLSSADLADVLVAYAESIDRVFYLLAAAGVVCFVFSWGLGWKDIRKKAPTSEA